MTTRELWVLVGLTLCIPGCKCGHRDAKPTPPAPPSAASAEERPDRVTCAAQQPGRPVRVARLEDGSTNMVTQVAVDARHVYFLMGTEERPLRVRRVSKHGGEVETLWTGWGARNGAAERVVLHGEHVYWIAGHERTAQPALYQLPKAGGDAVVLYTDQNLYAFALAGESAYVISRPWVSPPLGGLEPSARPLPPPPPTPPRLLRIPLGGGPPTTLATFDVGSAPGAPAVDDSGVFAAAGPYQPDRRVLYRIPLGGGEPEPVSSEGQARDWGLLLDRDSLYFVGEGNDYYRLPKRGGRPTQIMRGPFVTVGVLDGGSLFTIWAPPFDAEARGEPFGTGIRRVSAWGGEPATLLSRDAARAFASLAVDADCVYYARALRYGERELMALRR